MTPPKQQEGVLSLIKGVYGEQEKPAQEKPGPAGFDVMSLVGEVYGEAEPPVVAPPVAPPVEVEAPAAGPRDSIENSRNLSPRGKRIIGGAYDAMGRLGSALVRPLPMGEPRERPAGVPDIVDAGAMFVEPGPDMPDVAESEAIGSGVDALAPEREDENDVAVADVSGLDRLIGQDSVYIKSGREVLDTATRWADGRTATHRLEDLEGIVPAGMSIADYEADVLARPASSFLSVSDTALNDLDALEPDAAQGLAALIAALEEEGYGVTVNETLRPQARQEKLFRQGRADDGNIVTWTLSSDHSSGRAADLRIEGDGGYQRAWALAEEMGVRSMGAMDPGHFAVLADTTAERASEEGVPTTPTGQARRRQAADTLAKVSTDPVPAPEPDGSTVGGVARAAGSGLASGALSLMENVGIVQQYLGERLGSESLSDAGSRTAAFWEEKVKRFELPEHLQGAIADDPGLMANPEWLAYGVSSMLPGMGLSVLSGVGAARYLKVAGQMLPLAPKLISKLARIGGAITGGTVGGGLEGSQTYKEVLDLTGDEGKAASSAELMTLASGALNSISLLKMLNPTVGKGVVNFLKGSASAGAVEGVSEYLEEPAEALIKMGLTEGRFTAEMAKEQMRQGLNVLPLAMLTGGIGGGGSILIQRKNERASEDEQATLHEYLQAVEEGDAEAAESAKSDLEAMDVTLRPVEDEVATEDDVLAIETAEAETLTETVAETDAVGIVSEVYADEEVAVDTPADILPDTEEEVAPPSEEPLQEPEAVADADVAEVADEPLTKVDTEADRLDEVAPEAPPVEQESPSGIPVDVRGGYRKLVTDGLAKYEPLSDEEVTKKWGELLVSRGRTAQRAEVQHGQVVGTTNIGDKIAGTGPQGRNARGNDTQMRARLAALESIARDRGIELDAAEAFTDFGQSSVLEENKDLVGRAGTSLTSMDDDDLALAIVETMERWEGDRESDWLNERMTLLYYESESREGDDMTWLFGGNPAERAAAAEAVQEAEPEADPVPAKKTVTKKPKEPAAKKTEPEPVPEDGDGPRIVSLRKEEGAEIRERLDLDALDAPGVQGFEEVWDEAMEQGAAGQAVDVATAAAASGRALTPVEHAGAVQRYVELERELESSRALLAEAAKDSNDLVVQREMARSSRLLDEIDTLTTATDRAGTEAGRALSVRRLRANVDDYSLARGLQEARTKKGAALTPDEIAQIEALTEEVATLQTANADLVTANHELIAKREEVIAAAAVKAETRASGGGRRSRTRLKRLTEERTDLLDRLGSLGYRLNDVTGVSAEGLELIGKLAINRIRTAAVERGEKLTLQTVVDEVLADLNNADVTAGDVHEALAARSPEATKKAESLANRHLRELKAQATLLAKIADAEQGLVAPRRTRGRRSEEVENLQKQLTALRTRAYNTVQDGQKLESALRTIDELQDELAGVADTVRPETKRSKAEASPELAALRVTITGLKSELRTQAQIDELTEQISSGTVTEAPKRGTATASKELAAKRAELSELKAQAALLVKIEKAERGVFEGRRTPAQRSAAVTQLQKRLGDLRGAAQKSSRDEAMTARALATIDELQAQLAGSARAVKAKRAQVEVTPEMEALQEKVSVLRRELATGDALAEIEEQLRTGEFKIPEKRGPVATSPELERNQIALRKARKQWRQAIRDMNAKGTVRQYVKDTANFARTIKATADMSGTLRQAALLSARRPGTAVTAFGKSVTAFFSENSHDKIDNAIRSHPMQLMREQAGLELTDYGGHTSVREEDFASDFAERIPALGAVVRASNRSMTTTLNLIRTAAFDGFVETNPNATMDEMKAWASWVNVASGRGEIGRASAIGEELALMVFAPRFAWSRIQIASGQQLVKNRNNPRVLKAIAKDYAAALSTGMMTLALASMAGFEVGLDPREADFGRIRIGNLRIDIWAGVQQPMRLLARIALVATDQHGLTGRHLTDAQKNIGPLELLGRFAAFKASPAVTLSLELMTGENAVGEDRTPTSTAARAIMPIIVEGVYDAYREEGAGIAIAVGVGEFLGAGMQTYGDSQSRVRRDAQRLVSDGDSDGARTLMQEWNEANPDSRIMSVKADGETLALPPRATRSRGGGRGRSRRR